MQLITSLTNSVSEKLNEMIKDLPNVGVDSSLINAAFWDNNFFFACATSWLINEASTGFTKILFIKEKLPVHVWHCQAACSQAPDEHLWQYFHLFWVGQTFIRSFHKNILSPIHRNTLYHSVPLFKFYTFPRKSLVLFSGKFTEH